MRALTLAAVMLWTGIAQGKATIDYRTSFPGNEVIYGCPVTFYIMNPSGRIKSFLWEFRSKGDCVTPPRRLPGTGRSWTHTTRMTIPGTFEVRCTLTYYPDQATGKTPATESPAIDISVPPPDAVRFPLKSPSVPIGTDIPIRFTLLCKGKPVCSAIGHPQELLLNVTDDRGNRYRFSDTWIPPSPTARFYRSGATIVDLKRARATPAWFKHPEGKFESASQQLRIVIFDLCGTPIPYPLGTVKVEWIKDSKTHYHVEHSR